jgi:hypothetical protein
MIGAGITFLRSLVAGAFLVVCALAYVALPSHVAVAPSSVCTSQSDVIPSDGTTLYLTTRIRDAASDVRDATYIERASPGARVVNAAATRGLNETLRVVQDVVSGSYRTETQVDERRHSVCVKARAVLIERVTRVSECPYVCNQVPCRVSAGDGWCHERAAQIFLGNPARTCHGSPETSHQLMFPEQPVLVGSNAAAAVSTPARHEEPDVSERSGDATCRSCIVSRASASTNEKEATPTLWTSPPIHDPVVGLLSRPSPGDAGRGLILERRAHGGI